MPKEKEAEKEHLPQNELNKLQIVPERNKKTDADIMRLAKTDPPKTFKPAAQLQADMPNPMQVGEINKKDVEMIKALIPECDEEKRLLNKLSDQEKLEFLLRVVSEFNPLNLQRDRDESRKPRTVDEVLKDKKWDCDEIARVYTAIAWDLGVTNMAQFVARLRDKETGEVVGHAAVLYKTETGILYLDPATGSKRLFEGFSSFDALIKNKDFQNYLSDVCPPYNESKAGYDFVEGTAVSGKENADAVYYYEMGNYHSDQNKDAQALLFYEHAESKGLVLSELYFQIGQSHYFLGGASTEKEEQKREFEKAAKYFVMSIANSNDEKEKTEQYGYLCDAYFKLGKYSEAIKAGKEQLASNPISVRTDLAVGSAYMNLGYEKYHDKEYSAAIEYFDLAEAYLLNALKATGINKEDLSEIKSKLRDVYLKRHDCHKDLGDKTKEAEDLENTLKRANELGVDVKELKE